MRRTPCDSVGSYVATRCTLSREPLPPSTAERKDERERREVRAKSICGVCPVMTDCVDYAMEIREPYGIWGGLTESERRTILARAAV